MAGERLTNKGELANVAEVRVVNLADHREEIVALIKSVGLSDEDVDAGGVWLACRDAEAIIGCLSLEKRGKLVHIQSMSVDRRFRKRGIARVMVEKAMDDFVDVGESLVALTLFWNMKIYERMGFVRVNAARMKQQDDVAGRGKHKYCVAYVRTKDG